MKSFMSLIKGIKDALSNGFKRNAPLGDGKVTYTFSKTLYYLTGKIVGKNKGAQALGNQELPIEHQMIAAHQEAAAKEMGELYKEEATLQAGIKSGLFALDHFDQDADLRRVEEEFALRREALAKRKEEDVEEVQKLKANAQAEVDSIKAETEKEAEALGAPKHAQRVPTGSMRQILVGLVACLLDYTGLFLACEKFLPINVEWVMAASAAGLVVMVGGAKLLGKFLFKAFKDSRIGVAIALFTLAGVVIASGASIGLARWASEGSDGTDDAVGMFMLSLSIALPVVLAWDSYNFHSKYQPLRARLFNALQDHLKTASASVTALGEKLRQITEAYRTKEDALQAEYEEATTKIRLYKTEIMAKVNEDQQKLAQLPNELALIPHIYSAQANENVYAIRTYLLMHSEAPLNTQPPYFKNAPTRPEDFVIDRKDEVGSGPTDEFHVSSNGNGHKALLGKLPMVLLAVGLGILSLAGCSTVPPQSHVVELLLDNTEGRELAQVHTAPLLATVGLDTNGGPFRDQVTVNHQVIQDVSRSAITTLKLDASSHSENQYVRHDEVSDFFKDLDALLATPTDTTERDQSHIYQPLCERLKVLSALPLEGKKVVVVASDLLEAQRRGVDMYKPKAFEDEVKLRGDLEKCGCALPRLEGISIYLVHQPTTEDDERSSKAKRFYATWFSELGAVVTLAASL
jgi:hypothetical protein